MLNQTCPNSTRLIMTYAAITLVKVAIGNVSHRSCGYENHTVY